MLEFHGFGPDVVVEDELRVRLCCEDVSEDEEEGLSYFRVLFGEGFAERFKQVLLDERLLNRGVRFGVLGFGRSGRRGFLGFAGRFVGSSG